MASHKLFWITAFTAVVVFFFVRRKRGQRSIEAVTGGCDQADVW